MQNKNNRFMNGFGWIMYGGLTALFLGVNVLNRHNTKQEFQTQQMTYGGNNIQFILKKENYDEKMAVVDRDGNRTGTLVMPTTVNVLTILQRKARTNVPLEVMIAVEEDGMRKMERGRNSIELRNEQCAMIYRVPTNIIAMDIIFPAETTYGLGSNTNPVMVRIALNNYSNAFAYYNSTNTSRTSSNFPPPLIYFNMTPDQIINVESRKRQLEEKEKEFERRRLEQKARSQYL